MSEFVKEMIEQIMTGEWKADVTPEMEQIAEDAQRKAEFARIWQGGEPEAITEAFYKMFGGGFGYEGNLSWWSYYTRDYRLYRAPDGETLASMLQTLKESVENGQNLILTRWRLETPSPNMPL